jgi:hypothetical protein
VHFQGNERCTIEPSRTGTSPHSRSYDPPPWRRRQDGPVLGPFLTRVILTPTAAGCHDPHSGVSAARVSEPRLAAGQPPASGVIRGRYARRRMPGGDARPPGVPGLRRRGRRRTALPCPRDSSRARPGSRIPPDNLTVIATKFGLVPGDGYGGYVIGSRPHYVRRACGVSLKRSGHDVGQAGMQVRPDRREVLITCSIRPPSRCWPVTSLGRRRCQAKRPENRSPCRPPVGHHG